MESPGTSSPKIFFDKVSVHRGKAEVLKDLSFVMDAPMTLIIGANGSGKTTLMHALTGLVDFSGEITIGTHRVHQISKKELAQRMAYVPQLFKSLPKISVRDYIMLGRFPHLAWLGQFSKKDIELTDQVIRRLDLAHLVSKMVSQISGGELRKVSIARALVQGSPLILMDEPFQGLDPYQRKELYTLIESLLEDGKKILMVSHEGDVMERLKPQVLALKDRGLWFQGDIHDLPDSWVQELYSS